MRNFFQNMEKRVQQWMAGRYGMDELSRTLSFVGCLLLVLSSFEKLRILYLPALFIWILSIFRCYSKNILKRQKERVKYLQLTSRFREKNAFRKRRWAERKTHRHIKCKQCRKMFRVPKGKGKIKIRCPHCQAEIIKKT